MDAVIANLVPKTVAISSIPGMERGGLGANLTKKSVISSLFESE